MDNREKVIKALMCCMFGCDHVSCPYNKLEDCEGTLHYDALTLLKAQEPIVPKRVLRGAIMQWRCGACDARLGDPLMGDIDNYCRHCGKAVKWDG